MTELTAEYVRGLLPVRRADSNKASHGSVLNVAGSLNYRGAAGLSSVSALSVGAGYVTLGSIRAVADSVASLFPEIITIPLSEHAGSIAQKEAKRLAGILPKYSVLSIGCGLSTVFSGNRYSAVFFRRLMEKVRTFEMPVVVDADGLNILSGLGGFRLPERSVLTPHPGEMARLLGVAVADVQRDRLAAAEHAARKYSAVVVLKGSGTVVSDGHETFVNTTGNSALAKAGSGDVLTGMIAGLMAQGLTPLKAACLGVYLHGKSGEMASEKLTEYGVLASDLLEAIPMALKALHSVGPF